MAPGNGDIAAVEDDAFPVLLEALAHLLAFGDEHEAAGVAVEAVHDMGMAVLMGGGEVLVEDGDDGLIGRVLAVGEQTLVLVDDEEVLVFEDDVEVARTQTVAEGSLLDGYAHAGLEGVVELAGAASVDIDVVRQQFLHLRA